MVIIDGMRVLPFEVNSGEVNMKIDSDLLEGAIRNQEQEPIFRLYSWYPACVSLGRNQKADFLDRNLLEKHGIDVVRRLTGGRALLHDKEITYCYITPITALKCGDSVVESYKEISQIIIDMLADDGIEVTFGGTGTVDSKHDYCMLISTGADLCYQGKKLVGSAQLRKDGYILQHGSILVDYDKELLSRIFNEPVDDTITCIKEIKPELVEKYNVV